MRTRTGRCPNARPVARRLLGIGVTIATLPATSAIGQELEADFLTLDTPLIPPVVLHGIAELDRPATTLRERMADARVPGLSIAIVIDGEIAWARGLGLADVAEGREVTTTTLFQAASISKPVAAVGAMRLVQDGVMELDANIGDYLTRWQIPEPTSSLGWDRDATPVTLRQLLSHTAGMTVHGFPGYKRIDRIPTAVGVLNGEGNTDAVVIDAIPGSRHKYSGGGYTVAQVAMVDASNEFDDFPTLMSKLVLEPLDMDDSTFSQPLPEPLHDRAATGYQADGTPLDGSWVVHPEMAAAGLWTTPTDLAKLFASLQHGMARNDGPVLTADSVREMLRFEGDVRYGLGLNIGTTRIGHGGGNQGFRCVATFFNEGGDGVVIMSNGDNGWGVNSDVLRTIFVNLDWPGLRPIEKTVAVLTEAQLARCAGEYQMPGSLTFMVRVDDEAIGLIVTADGMQPFRLLPESEATFFDPDDGVPIVFDLTQEGPASKATWSNSTAKRVR